MSIAVVIVAAGRGRRFGGDVPKQYISVNGKTVLRRTVEVFLAQDDVRWIVPVIHADDRDLFDRALTGLDDPRVLAPVLGSDTRAGSVHQGLESLTVHAPGKVLIHDAARPFVPVEVIARVAAALDTHDGACAALPVVDALWRSEEAMADASVSRDGLWRAQTPQGFRFDRILAAHRAHDGSGADDVVVAKEHGLAVTLVLGSERNYKITTAADLERAQADAAVLDARSSN